jgi:hypothetical protein
MPDYSDLKQKKGSRARAWKCLNAGAGARKARSELLGLEGPFLGKIIGYLIKSCPTNALVTIDILY